MIAPASTYHCSSCGRPLFHSSDLIGETTWWEHEGYRAACFQVRELLEPQTLRHLAVWNHEGWYCCRLAAMRFVKDEFGTGQNFLVYQEAVVEVPQGAPVPTRHAPHAQLKLSTQDFDAVLSAPRTRLALVKFGAIWCPPCRFMDDVIEKVAARGTVSDTDFFEVDVDEEPTLWSRFPVRSIPFWSAYVGGKQVPFPDGKAHLTGVLNAAQLKNLSAQLLKVARGSEAVW